MNSNDSLQHYRNDEIDLFELVQNLWAQKWLIIGITAVITAIALLYALKATPIYETSARITPPSESDIAGFDVGRIITEASTIITEASTGDNRSDFKQYTTKDVYEIFKQNLLSQRVRNQFFEEYYLPYRGVRIDAERMDSDARDRLMNQFSQALHVEQVNRDQPDIYRVRVQLKNPEQAAEWANQYVHMAEAKAESEILNNIATELKAHAEATALRLESLLTVEKQRREDRVTRLQEALTIATALNIEDSQVAIGRSTTDSHLAAYVEGDLMYLRGTQALQAELAALNARESDEAFIPQLRNIENRERLLRTIQLDQDAVAMFTVDSPAAVPETPIKPKKLIIIALGVVLGGMLSVFLAAIRIAILKHSSSRSAN